VLDRVVQLLVANETVDGAQIYALAGRPCPPAPRGDHGPGGRPPPPRTRAGCRRLSTSGPLHRLSLLVEHTPVLFVDPNRPTGPRSSGTSVAVPALRTSPRKNAGRWPDRRT